MTNYEILKKRDMLAAMEERLNKNCRCCVNYERCGYPASKPSKEACKEMWRSFFKGADTPEKMANRMYRAADCDTCPVAGICGNIMCGCETAIIAWLMNENLLYTMAIDARCNRMTNFELITKDEFFLANWLSNVRMNCNICPVRRECTECEDTVDKLCFRVLYDWLKREA